MTTEFQLNVLGPPELVRGGGSGVPVRFRTKKHLAVLLYLHLEGRTRSVPRERLIALLWPEVPVEKGRHSLSQALLAIRSRLGNDAVTGKEKQNVQLLADLPSDLSNLQRGAATKVRVAEPLLGLEDCGGAEFAHWVDGARARLRIEARDSLRTALQTARASGNAAEKTQRLAAALYDIDPLCAEAVYALAERALLERDTVTAVRLLKTYVDTARSDLGSNLNPEIRSLLSRLERGERPLQPGREDVQERPHPFLGRERELGRLEAIANRVADKSAYVSCLVSGVPGVGKSALLRRFATSLEARAWPVFVVACQEIGQGIPYAAVSELITALARDSGAGGTDPLWLSEASRVCPGLRTTFPGVPAPAEAPADSIRVRIGDAVGHMLEAVTDNGPVLLAFDDLQFLDPASQEVLFLVTRRLARVPALFLAGARAGELGGFAWSEQIDLEAFDRPHTVALIHELSTDDNEPTAEIRDAIVRLAQGNPYHVEMLLADWRVHQQDSLVAAESIGDGVAQSWTPPADLRTTFARQYGEGGLSNDARHVLQVLAVAGKAMAPHDVASLVGLNEATSEGVVLELLDRGIARVEAWRLSFKNELHRAFVYHAMGTDRRTYHHAQFAKRLAGARDAQQLQTMLELVHHSIGAGLESQAMELGALAAENAIAQGAPREAERMLNWLLRAYEVPAGSRLRLLLAHALDAAGQYQRALDALAAWRDETAPLADRALAALIRVDAMHRARLGGDDAILHAAQQAIALAEQANATPFLVRANSLRLEVALDGCDLTTTADALALAARIAASPASPECIAMAQFALGQGELAKGEFGAAVGQLTAAVPVLRSLGLWLEVRRCLNTLGVSYRGLGQISDAIRVFQDNVAVAERSGHLGAVLQSQLLLGNIYHDVAWFAAAAECMRAVIGMVETIRTPRAWAEAYSNIVRLALVLGNQAEAELAVERCEDGARRSALWRHRVTALMARADLHLAAGQTALAWLAVEEAMHIAGDRSQLLPDGGPYTRLQHQYVFATRGYDALKTLGGGGRLAMYDSWIDAFEVRLFDEAVALASGDGASVGTPVLDEAMSYGLLGPLARLIAYGVQHPGVPARRNGESAAQLIARAYPDPQHSTIPTAISSR